MGRARKTGRLLEVRARFEPTRLGSEHLADAYERIIPILRRSLGPSQEGNNDKPEAITQRAGGARR